MARDTLPRSGRFATAVALGALVAFVLVVFTGSPAWGVVFLILAVGMVIVWPREEARQVLAWRDRGVPPPSWPYWLVSAIAYLSFVGVIGALFVREWGFATVCALISFVTQFARMVLRGRQVGRSLNLPRRAAVSPRFRRVLLVSHVAYAVTVLAFIVGQYVLAFVVGVPAVICLVALATVRQRQVRRVLEETLRERGVES